MGVLRGAYAEVSGWGSAATRCCVVCVHDRCRGWWCRAAGLWPASSSLLHKQMLNETCLVR
eukprot:1140267-Pelagomonas_calceolata.AAC.8